MGHYQHILILQKPIKRYFPKKLWFKPDSQNDKFNFLENKLIDTNSLSVDATNMVKNKLMDTMMKTVKNSKYGKMIPSKLLSSLV
jgi:hypothetical protein